MQKQFLVAALIGLCSTPLFAAKSKVVESKISQVTVYTNGAQISRTIPVSLSPGTNEIVIEGVSPNIQAKSLQVMGKGSFTILESRHQVRYPEPVSAESLKVPEHIKRKIKLAEDSLSDVDFDLLLLTSQLENLGLERNMILNNPIMKGQGRSDSLELLEKAMNVFRLRLQDINLASHKAKKDKAFLTGIKNNLNNRLQVLRNYSSSIGVVALPNTPIQQVVITLSAKSAAKGSIKVSYLVSGAGWTPSYDIRAKGTDDPMKLTYKASVYQSTGISWDNVTLKLSSNNPYSKKTKPTLGPWWVGNQPQLRLQGYNGTRNDLLGAYGDTVSYKVSEFNQKVLDDDTDACCNTENGSVSATITGNTSPYQYTWSTGLPADPSLATVQSQIMTQVEYDISLPYSIESDGRAHLVAIKEETISANYYYTIIPKVDKQAFLSAKISGWEDLKLLPGEARIYFDETFIGETSIDPKTISDTLEFSLGPDPNIVVKRVKDTDEWKEKIIGTDKVKKMGYAISVKNTNSAPISVVILDQIPVTKDPDIAIELEKDSRANYDEEKGILTWRKEIKPYNTSTVKFTYSIQHNKHKLLSNL